ncbi:transcriptional regulator SUPERMAN-like [Rosa sericea]
MFRKPNLGSAESSKKSPNDRRSYICTSCSLSFTTSQAFAGHHNAHRPRHDRWRLSQEENNANNPALAEPNDSKRPLSPDPISSGRPDDDEHNSPFYTFMTTERDVRTPADPAPAPALTSRSGSGPGQDLASGSSTGENSSYGENPKKRKFSELTRLKTGSADESWLKL